MRLASRLITIAALAAAGSMPAVAAMAGTTPSLAVSAAAHAARAKAAVAHVGQQATSPPGGTRLWVERFNGGAKRSGAASAVAVSPDRSTVYVAGATTKTSGARGENYNTVAYNAATGAEIWKARFPGSPRSHPLGAPDIAVSPDGTRVFVTGELGDTGIAASYLVLAYNAVTGTQEWISDQENGQRIAGSLPVAVSPDSSTVFVTGNSGHFYITIAFAAASGSRLWSTASPLIRNVRHQADSIAVSPDGSQVFVTGADGTVALDAATGAMRWQDIYKIRSQRHPDFLAVSPDSATVYVTSSRGTIAAQIMTVAYNAVTGARLWRALYTGPGSGSGPSGIAVSPDGSRVFVTGSYSYVVRHTFANRLVTIAYAAPSGARLWTATYRGPGDQDAFPVAIAVSPDGSRVFVIAAAKSPNAESQFATASYDAATGTAVWTARYQDMPGVSASPAAMAVSPDGSQVFVAGASGANTTGSKYLTVTYQA
jgi:DNA-binding beta-propeller fold protein YncE